MGIFPGSTLRRPALCLRGTHCEPERESTHFSLSVNALYEADLGKVFVLICNEVGFFHFFFRHLLSLSILCESHVIKDITCDTSE